MRTRGRSTPNRAFCCLYDRELSWDSLLMLQVFILLVNLFGLRRTLATTNPTGARLSQFQVLDYWSIKRVQAPSGVWCGSIAVAGNWKVSIKPGIAVRRGFPLTKHELR